MYKILVVDKDINVANNEAMEINYVQSKDLEDKLKIKEYDLIYLNKRSFNKEINKIILNDYMELPSILEKLALNRQKYITFINMQILNKLIMDNIKIIEYSNYYEELVIANVVKQKIIKPRKNRQIYKEICLSNQEYLDVKKTVSSVIKKSYSGGNFWRNCKYVLKKNKIQEMFFNKIIRNIRNDIESMEDVSVLDI